jgi:acetoacetate decarboxylase
MAWAKDGAHCAWMRNCEGLYAAWESDPELLARIVPPPLKPLLPVVLVYVIEAHNPSFSTAYKEAALMTVVSDGEKAGNYCLSLLLTGSDNPVTTGREEFGIPKKNADHIDLRRVGNTAFASVKRCGIRLIDIEAELGDYNNEMGARILGGKTLDEYSDGVSFYYKFDIDQDSDCNVGFSNLRMLDVRTRRRFHTWTAARAQIALKPSVNDPWAELLIKDPIGAAWSKFDLGLLGCHKQVSLKNLDAVIPYLIAGRYDAPFYGYPTQIL